MPEKETLAAINSILNGLAALLLICGYLAIRQRNWKLHATFMLSALACSALFLTTYLTSYFYWGERSSGLQANWLRTVYLLILFPHIALAIVMLPMIGMTLWRVSQRRFIQHKVIARPTLAVWVYVSLTGIVVYGMLYHLIPWYAKT